jgi:hypothetical protein
MAQKSPQNTLTEVVAKWEKAKSEINDIVLHLKAGVWKEDEFYKARKALIHDIIGKVF